MISSMKKENNPIGLAKKSIDSGNKNDKWVVVRFSAPSRETFRIRVVSCYHFRLLHLTSFPTFCVITVKKNINNPFPNVTCMWPMVFLLLMGLFILVKQYVALRIELSNTTKI